MKGRSIKATPAGCPAVCPSQSEGTTPEPLVPASPLLLISLLLLSDIHNQQLPQAILLRSLCRVTPLQSHHTLVRAGVYCQRKLDDTKAKNIPERNGFRFAKWVYVSLSQLQIAEQYYGSNLMSILLKTASTKNKTTPGWECWHNWTNHKEANGQKHSTYTTK